MSSTGNATPFSRDRLIQEELRGFLEESYLSMSLAKPPSSQSVSKLIHQSPHCFRGSILSCATLSVVSLTSNHFATTVPNWRCS